MNRYRADAEATLGRKEGIRFTARPAPRLARVE